METKNRHSFGSYEKLVEALHEEQRENGACVEFIRLYETPTSYAEARREWMELE